MFVYFWILIKVFWNFVAIQCSVCFFSGFSTCHCSAPNPVHTNAGSVGSSVTVSSSKTSPAKVVSSKSSSSNSSSKNPNPAKNNGKNSHVNKTKVQATNSKAKDQSPAKLKCDKNGGSDPDSNPAFSDAPISEIQDTSKDEQDNSATRLRLGKWMTLKNILWYTKAEFAEEGTLTFFSWTDWLAI